MVSAHRSLRGEEGVGLSELRPRLLLLLLVTHPSALGHDGRWEDEKDFLLLLFVLELARDGGFHRWWPEPQVVVRAYVGSVHWGRKGGVFLG